MTLLQAIVFGAVQGLGEFLPISSSAHLTVLPWLARWDDPGLAADVALHLGTLVALLVYFRSDIVRITAAFIASLRERRIGDDPDRRIAWLVLAGCIPGGVAGLALEHHAEETFREASLMPVLIASTMIGMGLLLEVADRFGSRTRALPALTLPHSLLIGLAQACAIVPGVSRSGSTISAARALGYDREAAARFSFLLALPITAGAGLYKVGKPFIRQLLGKPAVEPLVFDANLLIAIAVAALSGYLAIEVLLRFVRTRSYLPFVVYRVLFGVGLIAIYLARR